MAAKEIQISSFEFSGFYYAEILESLLLYKRQNVPELTDESDFEPFIQLLRMTALVGHLNNVLIDLVANESTLPTASLAESVRNQMRLIDYELAPASPATVDVVYQLSAVFDQAREIVSEDAQAATRPSVGEVAVPYESLNAVSISRTDFLTKFWVWNGTNYVDATLAANSTNFPYSPNINAAGRMLYWIHDSVMWDTLNIVVTAAAVNLIGVFEYSNGLGVFSSVRPTAVVLVGSTLVFNVNSLLGASNRAGATVRVRFNASGTFQDVVSTWDGSKNVATTNYLGQTAPSTSIDDYQIGSDWTELAFAPNFVDGTNALTTTGKVSFTLPQSELLNWQKTNVNGQVGYAMRWRTINSVGGSNPTFARQRIDLGKQYVLSTLTQGRAVKDDPLGSSNGTANQTFQTTRDHFISKSEVVTVDNEPWTRVRDFLASKAQDKHYRLVLGENDRATVEFGDGVAGRLPPVGAGNIKITYRVDAHNDGNVGARTIVVDKTGLSYVGTLFNPRQASGWATAEGSTAASLARAKVAGPASLRVRESALTPDDLIALTLRFTNAAGAKPFQRALAIEGGFGPKTVMVVVVAAGGGAISQQTLDELTLYFNGDKYATPPVPKHFVANQKATAVNYTPRPINISARVTAPKTVTVEAIANQLASVFQPEALKEDEITYEWEFGAEVPLSRISHEIFEADERITKVELDVPTVDTLLNPTELPVLGSLAITMVEPA